MSPIRVVMVDDSAAFLAAAAVFLESLPGVKVVGRATCAAEALPRINDLQPGLVLMDVAMPEIDGFQATHLIKARADAPKVVMLSMHNSEAYRRRCEAVGAEAFVVKDELVVKLPSLLASLFPGSCP